MGKFLKFGCIGVVGLVVVAIIISAVAGGGAKDSTTASVPSAKTETSTTKAEQAKVSQTADQKSQTAAKPTPTQVPIPKIGDKVAAGNWEYAVTKVDRQKTLEWSSFGNKTDAKGEWLIVYLTLKNIGKENFTINTWDFDLYAGDVKYTPSTEFGFVMWLQNNKLSNIGAGEKFPPGVEVKTAILFDIAPDAKGLRLQLKQAKKDILLE